jgi:cell division inhibitor SulA
MDFSEPQNKQSRHTKSNKLDQIDQLIEQHSGSHIWRGSHNKHQPTNKGLAVLSTGYRKLDELLYLGGWPLTSTAELGLTQAGIGELRLLTPALRQLQQGQQQNIIFVAPPFLPFAPALIKEQIDTRQLTIIQTHSIQDTLWTTEQALLAECCAAVLSWTGNYNLTNRELRRLQLAAEKSNTWNVLFRHSDCLKQTSVAGLRLHLQSNSYSQLDLHILKQPQAWGGQRCTLSLQPHYENWQRLPASLLPQHNQLQTPYFRQRLHDQPTNKTGSEHNHASVTVLGSLASLQVVH